MPAATPVARGSAGGAAPPLRSLQSLDWLNFFLAALLTGFGPVVALYLADLGWTPGRIGVVLTAGGLAGLLAQLPAGELMDVARSKRAIVAAGTGAITLGVLVFGVRPDAPALFSAFVLQGVVGGVLGPGITAISLGLVGSEALGERLGRNQRFASVGSLAASGILGVAGYLLAARDRFLLTAALELPVLVALARIRSADIHFARACCAADDHPTDPRRSSRASLFKDRRLLTFAACLFLFQAANASLLPLLGERLARTEGPRSSLVMSALIVMPQMLVALLSPWAGRTADTWGRRPLLLIALGVVPVRSAIFAWTVDPVPLVLVQVFDGLSGAVLGVLTALVIADLAKGTGRFNLAQGLVGTLSGIGASLSTSISGVLVERLGDAAGFLSVTAVGLLAVVLLWAFMPETRPSLAPKPAHRQL